MIGIVRLHNPVRSYAWGSHRHIAELLGTPSPSGEPQAEMWIGAHPSATSEVEVDGGRVPLDELIAADPDRLLGADAARRFERCLPFLFKVLAVAEPLSLQVHPSRDQARAGFAREERLTVPADDAQRLYRDRNHKPEIVCALTPFWALQGFRHVEASAALLEQAVPQTLGGEIGRLRSSASPEAGLRQLLTTLLELDSGRRRRMLAEARRATVVDAAPFRWLGRLIERYPDDSMALAPLFLDVVRLDPGQALYTDTGVLHSYLEGMAVELMANSDNVLRCGLTQKRIAREELLEVVRCAPSEAQILEGRRLAGESVFETEAEEFRLSILERPAGDGGRLDERDAAAEAKLPARNVEILLCTAGTATLRAGAVELRLERGSSWLVPASAPAYRIDGEARIFKATVPPPRSG